MPYDLPRDRREGATPFSWPTRTLLHSIVLAALEEWLTGAHVAAAAALVAEDAHRRGLAVEHAVVAVKREWAELPDVRLLDVARARDLLDILVTACIKAYYERPRAMLPAASLGPDEGVAPGPTPQHRPERTETVVTLLHVMEAIAPGAFDGEPAESLDPDATARLTRALADVSAEEMAALVTGLQRILRALQRQRRPDSGGRRASGIEFRPRAP